MLGAAGFIPEFRRLYRETFGEELSAEEARETATALGHLIFLTRYALLHLRKAQAEQVRKRRAPSS